MLRAADRAERTRDVFRQTILMLLLVSLASAATGLAQVRSSAASVTLVARLDESFSLQHVAVPAEQSFNGDIESAPQALQVDLCWTLRQARDFKIQYKLERQSDAGSSPSDSGLMSLKRLGLISQIFSFIPFETSGPPVVGVWGNNEEDPVGRAALLMVLPKSGRDEPLTVRISAVIL
jgi:hypothetical protein